MKYFAIFIALASWLIALNPDTVWTRTYGGPDHDFGYAVRVCPDHGFIIGGATTSFGSGGWDVYLVRTDANGDTLWTRTFGGPDHDEGRAVALTPDGGFLVAGYTNSYGAGGRDIYLVRGDADGDTLWTRTYGGTLDDEAASIQPSLDGGYIIGGTTYSFGAGVGDIYLLKIDSLGDTLWTRTFGGTSTEVGAKVQVLTDSFLIIAGSTWSYGAGSEDAYLIKTDPKGDTIWTRTHGGDNREEIYDLVPTTDQGFLAAGSSYFSLLGYDFFVFKTDHSGNVQWNYFNGSLGDDYAYAVAEIPGRGYLIGGNFSYELFLIRVDTAGSHYQYWIFGGPGADCCQDLAVLDDASYLALANTTSFGQGQTDIWLLRFSRDTLFLREHDKTSTVLPELTVCPNPFHARLRIRLTVNGEQWQQGHASLKIYDSAGCLVKDLSFLTFHSFPEVLWDGTDEKGWPAAAGVYIVHLEHGGKVATVRAVKLK